MTTKGPCRSFSFWIGHSGCMQALETERILVVEQVLLSIVEALRMSAVDVGHVQRQRLSTKWDVGNALLVEELVQQETSCWVRPTAKRHDDASAAPGCGSRLGSLLTTADILVKTPP